MIKFLRVLFLTVIVKPLVLVILGLNIRHRELVPKKGPLIIAANHNSHLDVLVLILLFPFNMYHKIKLVGAKEFFYTNPVLSWFSKNIMQIIPLERKSIKHHTDPFSEVTRALEAGEIIVLFPEGKRGDPEILEDFKTGIYHLAKKNPQVPILPVFMYGLGKAMPRDEGLIVPFICDVFIGEPIAFNEDRAVFMETLVSSMHRLSSEGNFPVWE